MHNFIHLLGENGREIKINNVDGSVVEVHIHINKVVYMCNYPSISKINQEKGSLRDLT